MGVRNHSRTLIIQRRGCGRLHLGCGWIVGHSEAKELGFEPHCADRSSQHIQIRSQRDVKLAMTPISASLEVATLQIDAFHFSPR
jgi:hypothetical protein